jgi:hypothetical protein
MPPALPSILKKSQTQCKATLPPVQSNLMAWGPAAKAGPLRLVTGGHQGHGNTEHLLSFGSTDYDCTWGRECSRVSKITSFRSTPTLQHSQAVRAQHWGLRAAYAPAGRDPLRHVPGVPTLLPRGLWWFCLIAFQWSRNCWPTQQNKVNATLATSF